MLLLLPFLRLLLFFLLILILRLFLLLLLLLLLHNPWVHLPLAAEASLITSHEFRRNPRSMFAKRQKFTAGHTEDRPEVRSLYGQGKKIMPSVQH